MKLKTRSLQFASRVVAWALISSCLLVGARAGETAGAFDQANKLYEEGKYREAAKAYRGFIPQGRVSPALFFNLGNALFKSGEVGRAILCYRLAEQLSPRDPDIRANLQFARDSVGGGALRRATVLWRLFSVLTANEVTVLFACGAWVWFGLLAAKELRPELGASLSAYTKTAAVCFVVVASWLAVVLSAELRDAPAVVVANEAVVRYGPFDESQSFFTLRDGAELTIVDQKDNWYQVKDASGRLGWLRANQLARVAPQSALDGS